MVIGTIQLHLVLTIEDEVDRVVDNLFIICVRSIHTLHL